MAGYTQMRWIHPAWNSSPCSKCGEDLWSYQCIRTYQAANGKVGEVWCAVAHQSCRKCDPDPQRMGLENCLETNRPLKPKDLCWQCGKRDPSVVRAICKACEDEWEAYIKSLGPLPPLPPDGLQFRVFERLGKGYVNPKGLARLVVTKED